VKDISDARLMAKFSGDELEAAMCLRDAAKGNDMTQSKWRAYSNKVIGDVVSSAMMEDPNMDEKELRKRISAAYPFGERAYHPYKIWLSCVKHWLGKRLVEKDEPGLPSVEKDEFDLPLFGGLTE